MFQNAYNGKRVLITGHTGFKGSWLAFWLRQLGAELCGVGLPMEGEFCHSALLKLPLRSETCDIRNAERLNGIFAEFQPEIVFHLAAQPLVRRSYREPAATFETNVMGTVNVLDACRRCGSVRAIVAITSDKCYENREWSRGYRESDPMGGYDPYSASKGCSELVISSYRRSFFNCADYGTKHRTLLASGRAGNVIGGGDWAEDRLVPDMVRAAAADRAVEIRSPHSTRPWQHVLEPLSGYLALGQKLLAGEHAFADGWNFGPADDSVTTVEETVRALAREWGKIRFELKPPTDAPHEAQLLRLDCSRARRELGWHGVWSMAETLRRTAAWYRDFYENGHMDTAADLRAYTESAAEGGLEWTK